MGGSEDELRGVPSRSRSDEREDAGVEEGIRGGRIYRRGDGALERQRGLQRGRGARGGARAQGRGGDEETPRERFSHHRAADRRAPENARLRSLPTLPARIRRAARGHVRAREAARQAPLATRARRRPHPAHRRRRGLHRLRAEPARGGVHGAHREDVRQRGHHPHVGHHPEGGGAVAPGSRYVRAGMDRILVAGAGVFGVTAAIELRERGHEVALIDPGPLPHPLAASTDISKVVRLEYGADEQYTALAERAIEGWRRWNRDLAPLYHEVGLLFLRRTPMRPGTLEQDSFDVLSRRGHPIEVLDAKAIRKRFPAWSEAWTCGTFNPVGGFVESGKAIARLIEEARRAGVELVEGKFTDDLKADQIVFALGAWTPHVLPHLAGEFRSTGHPVFHLMPRDPAPFAAEKFPVFCADIYSTGWYGFPVHPSTGVVKIARAGPGRPMHPESPDRAVTAEEMTELRAFLSQTFPQLADAPLVSTRV